MYLNRLEKTYIVIKFFVFAQVAQKDSLWKI